MHVAVLYVVASILLGLLAGRRRLGFWGGFYGSLLLTPLIGVLLVFTSNKLPDDSLR